MSEYTLKKIKSLKTEIEGLKKANREIQALVDCILCNVVIEYGTENKIVLHNLNVAETLKHSRVSASKDGDDYIISLESIS